METSKQVHIDVQKQNITEIDTCVSSLRNVGSQIISLPKSLINSFHIELITTLYCLGYLMPNSFVQNLVIYKLSAEKYPSETYNELNTTAVQEIQHTAAEYLLVLNLVRQIPGILITLFMGSWSDIYGRKLAITIPLFGSILMSIIFLLNYFYYEWPAKYIILAAIPAGLTGDYCGFLSGVFGYVRIIHTLEAVAMRISFLEGIDNISIPLGPLIGGQLFSEFGYPAVFICSITLHVLALLFATVKINNKTLKEANWTTMVEDFFKYRAIVESFKTMFKKRDDNRRAHLIAVLVTVLLCFVSFNGYVEIIYLYAMLRFDWDVIYLNYNYMIFGGCQAIGMLFLLPLLIRYFKIPEIVFGMIGCVGFIAFYLGTALATSTLELYCACILLIVGSMLLVCLRSCISKWVPVQEIGKIMSVYAIFQAVGRALGQIISTQIYLETISIFPGSFFLTAAFVIVIILCIYSWIFIDNKRRAKKRQDQEGQNQDQEVARF